MARIKVKLNTNAIDYVLEKPNRQFIHVVNCQGVMGSGVAKEVRLSVPEAYEEYIDAYDNGRLKPGVVTKAKGFYNLAAQEFYGNDGKKYINYGALADCLRITANNLRTVNLLDDIEVVFPYRMGADRAGGNWDVIVELIEYYLGEFKITACKIGE